jgi:hypothetical protein
MPIDLFILANLILSSRLLFARFGMTVGWMYLYVSCRVVWYSGFSGSCRAFRHIFLHRCNDYGVILTMTDFKRSHRKMLHLYQCSIQFPVSVNSPSLSLCSSQLLTSMHFNFIFKLRIELNRNRKRNRKRNRNQ